MLKVKKTWVFIALLIIYAIHFNPWPAPSTGQNKYYNNSIEISHPAPGWRLMIFTDSENTSVNLNMLSILRNEEFYEVV